MAFAINEAKKACGEIPVGAVIAYNNEILSYAHNMKEQKNDPTAHAEILAIREASRKIGNWRLSECDIYVTLEPCPMCTGAIAEARINRVYFGAYDCLSKNKSCFPKSSEVYGGICEDECTALLQQFFKNKR